MSCRRILEFVEHLNDYEKRMSEMVGGQHQRVNALIHITESLMNMANDLSEHHDNLIEHFSNMYSIHEELCVMRSDLLLIMIPI